MRRISGVESSEDEQRRGEEERVQRPCLVLMVLVDWIPLSVGSVRPTQGRTVAISQVSDWDRVLCRPERCMIEKSPC